MMQLALDFFTTWLFNAMEICFAMWVILRMFEKICDIALKIQEYEKKRRAEGAQ
jgi:hypothetical protein